jgi:hypothetical protein
MFNSILLPINWISWSISLFSDLTHVKTGVTPKIMYKLTYKNLLSWFFLFLENKENGEICIAKFNSISVSYFFSPKVNRTYRYFFATIRKCVHREISLYLLFERVSPTGVWAHSPHLKVHVFYAGLTTLLGFPCFLQIKYPFAQKKIVSLLTVHMYLCHISV